MLPFDRRYNLQLRIIEQGAINIKKISEDLEVSEMTIRRDLKELEKQGKLIRTRGGAISSNSLILETTYKNKKNKNLNIKKKLLKRQRQLSKEIPQ